MWLAVTARAVASVFYGQVQLNYTVQISKRRSNRGIQYEADPTKSGLDKVAAKSLERARWALATTTSRSRSSRRALRDLEHFDSVQVGSFPIFSLPGAELSAAHAWQDSSVPGCSKRLLAATRCPHLSPALHQPSPETRSDFQLLCVWRRQVWQQ